MIPLPVKETRERLEAKTQSLSMLYTLENARDVIKLLFDQYLPNTNKEYYLKDLNEAIIRLKEKI